MMSAARAGETANKGEKTSDAVAKVHSDSQGKDFTDLRGEGWGNSGNERVGAWPRKGVCLLGESASSDQTDPESRISFIQ